MARQLLAEGLKGSFPFIADTTKIVVESLPNGKTRTRIPGRFSVCDSVNGNGRRYGKRVWEKNLQNGSLLMQSISENAAFGLLEHPKDGQVTLQSPIAILTTAAQLREGRDQGGKIVHEVVGEIAIVGTEEGKKLTALIEAGYNPRVSSRGFGSLVRAADGVDDVQEDYVCEGWDVVAKPSFESAILTPPREESVPESKPAPTAPISETVVTTSDTPGVTVTAIVTGSDGKPTVQNLTPGVKVTLESEEGSQAPGAAAPQKPVTESSQTKTMQLSEIKSQIIALKGTAPAKLNPTQFAEGMSQLSALHQEVANYVAEDAKRSWQGTQLHNEIANIETSWSECQLAPQKAVSKLNENNSKLLRVVKAVAETAQTFKRKLAESAKRENRQNALLHEVTERGQAWRQHALAMEQEAIKYRRRFMMASEAVYQLGGKYKTDITEMGKAHLALEFKEKITPEVQKMLNEAKVPKALVAIRNVLEGKVSPDASKGADGKSAAPVTESKTAAAPVAQGNKPAAAAGSPTAPVSEGVAILSTAPTDPRGVTEAISMVGRLSKAIAG